MSPKKKPSPAPYAPHDDPRVDEDGHVFTALAWGICVAFALLVATVVFLAGRAYEAAHPAPPGLEQAR